MSDEPDGPLDGAAIGETRTVEHETEMWLGAVPDSDDVRGRDRTAEYRLADTEVVTDDVGDRLLRVTVESEVTKQLPRDWDQEPRERSGPSPSKSERVSRVQRVGGVLLGLAISGFVTVGVMRHVTGALAGETVTFGPQPSLLDLAPVFFLVGLLVVFIGIGMPYLPVMAGRGDQA